MATIESGRRPPRLRRIPGEEGTWVFILGDMTVFALLFGVYLYYRGQAPEVFERSQAALNQDFGAINTLLLLTSSLLVVSAVRAVRGGRPRGASPLLIGALACGGGFVVNKVVEYRHEISEGLTPSTDDFFMYFYVLTGLHLFHLLCGMALLVLAIVLSRREALTGKQLGYLEGSAAFWHMVDALWIVLFPLLYLVH